MWAIISVQIYFRSSFVLHTYSLTTILKAMAKVCPNQLRHLRNESHSKITNTKNSTFNPIYSTYIDFILHFFPDFFKSIHKLQRSGLYQNPYYQPSAKSIFTCQIEQQNCLTVQFKTCRTCIFTNLYLLHELL